MLSLTADVGQRRGHIDYSMGNVAANGLSYLTVGWVVSDWC